LAAGVNFETKQSWPKLTYQSSKSEGIRQAQGAHSDDQVEDEDASNKVAILRPTARIEAHVLAITND
jgi:hypothetical protein